MNCVYKQIVNDDGHEVPVESQVWHYTHHVGGDVALLCTGEFVEEGCGSGVYESKVVKRGGITCETCLEIIREYKAIKL